MKRTVTFVLNQEYRISTYKPKFNSIPTIQWNTTDRKRISFLSRTVKFMAIFLVLGLAGIRQADGQTASFTTTGGTNSGSVTEACTPTTMYFTDTSTGATSWTWDFGNSNTVTTTDPVVAHSQSANYPQPGVYTVTLTINGGGSPELIYNQTIKVYPRPNPTVSGTQIGCAPFSTTLTANATPVVIAPFSMGSSSVGGITGGAASTYKWDFFGDIPTVGPQTSPTLNLTNVPIGTYDLLLTVTDVHGCSKTAFFLGAVTVNPTPTVDFSFVKSCGTRDVTFTGTASISSGTITSYGWDIGNNGNTESMLQNYAYNFATPGSYDVVFTAISSANCASTPKIKTVVFNSGNAADFSSAGNCVGQSVVFTESGTNVSSRVWDFGDGVTSTSANPSHTYGSTGSKTVKLTVTFSDGCTSEITHNVTINGAVSAFTYSTSSSCAPNYTINFTSTSVPASGTITSYGWDFNNDGIIDVSTGTPNTSHDFGSTGTKSVGLTVTTSDGCVNKVVSNVVIPATSTIDFSATPLNGCVPLNSAFTAVYDGGSGTVTGYSWNFGDPASGVSNTSTAPSPSHSYTVAGKYDVSLTITTSNGCTLTTTKTGYIAAGSPQNITLVTASQASYCLTNTVEFTATINALTDRLVWNFNDGTANLDQVVSGVTTSTSTHGYASPGTKSVSLTAYYNGCPSAVYTLSGVVVKEPTAGFTYLPAKQCDIPKTVNFTSTGTGATSYLWDFGDPTYSTSGNLNTSTLANPSHTYTVAGDYAVTLTVTNSSTGCSAVATSVIYVTTSVPKFTVNNTIVCAGTASAFTNEVAANSSANFAVSSYLWNFGDGQTSDQPNPSHTYTTPGLYNVTLQVTGTHGCVYSYTLPTQIDVRGPIVNFTSDAPQICRGQAVTFTDVTTRVSNDPATTNTWYWTFGDGGNSSDQNPSHIFTGTGNYNVTLQVTDNLGCVSSKSVTSSVIVPNIVAGFTTTRTIYCADATTPVVFTNSASVSSGSIDFYDWDLNNDGDYEIIHGAANQSLIFASPGTFTIKQRVISNLGCTAEFSKVITVVDGTGSISISSENLGCAPATGMFQPVDDAGIVSSYLWNFGDGQTSTERSPNHYFLRPGTYVVRLTETLTGGCVKTTTRNIKVDGAIGVFTYGNTPECAPHTENFRATGLSSVTSLTWDFGDGITTSESITEGNTSATIDHTYTTWGSRLPILILRDPVCGDYAYYYGVDQRINTSEAPVASFDFTTVLGTGLDCQNLNIQFTDKSTKGNDPRYSVSTWDWDFGDGSAHSFVQNPTHIYTSPGNKSATLTVTNGFLTTPTLACPASTLKSIPVNPTPDVTSTNKTQIICSGSSSTDMVLSSSLSETTFNWTRNTPAGITSALATSGTGVAIGGTIPGGVFTNSSSAPIVVTYTITPKGPAPTYCEGTPITATVTVNPIPTVIQPDNITVCNNSSVSVTFDTPSTGGTTTYSWVNDNTSINLPGSGNGNLSFTAINSGTTVLTANIIVTPHYVNSTGGPTCNGSTKTFTITVQPTPVVTSSGNETFCSGGTTNIVLSTTVPGTKFYYAAPVITPGGSSAVSGWSSRATPGNTSAITDVLVNNTAVIQTVTYTVYPIINGCVGTAINVAVTVNPKPVLTTGLVQSLCANAAGNATASRTLTTTPSMAGAVTFSWPAPTLTGGMTYTSHGFGSTIIDDFNNPTTEPQTATYSVTPTAPAGLGSCVGNPVTVVITVNPKPVVTAGLVETICSGNNANRSLTSTTTGVTFSYPAPTISGLAGNITGGNARTAPGSTANITDALVNTTTSPQTATYAVIPWINGCSGDAVNVVITVNPAPQVDQPSNQIVCYNTATSVAFSTQNTGGTTTYTWTNSNPAIGLAGATGSGDISFTSANATGAPISSTIVVTPHFANGGKTCDGATKTFTITVNPQPQVTQPADLTVCNTATATVNFATTNTGGTTTYSWTNSNTAIGLLTATGSGNLSFTATNSGTSPISSTVVVTPHFTNSSGGPSCDGPTKTFTITVNPTPTLNSTLTPAAICSGSLFSYTPTSLTTGTTFTWTRALVTGISNAIGSGSDGISETLTNTTAVQKVVTYRYTLNAGFCTQIQNVAVTVNPKPVLTTGLVQNLCANAAGNATASRTLTTTPSMAGAVTFSWPAPTLTGGMTYTSHGFGSTIIDDFNNPTTEPQTATYSVTPTAPAGLGSCVGNPVTVVITVNPKPVVTAGLVETICSGNNANRSLTSTTTGVTFSYPAPTISGLAGNITGGNARTAPGSTANITDALVNTTTSPQTATYAVIPWINGCSGDAVNVVITVNPAPQVDQPSNQIVCYNTAASVAFSTQNTGGTTTYTWTNSNPAIGLAGATGSGDISFTSANATGAPISSTIVVTPHFANGGKTCDGATKTFTITVNPQPQVTQPADLTVCNTATATVNFATTNTGGTTTYSWTNSNTAIGLLTATGSGNLSFTATNSGISPISSTVVVTPHFTNSSGGSSCDGPTKTFTITVNPTGQVNAIGNQELCNNTSTTLVTFGTTHTGGTTTYTWINDTPSIGLAATSGGNATQIPSFTALNISSSPVVATITVTPTFTFEGSSCNGPTESFTITVNPTPTVTSASSLSICSGLAVNYTPTSAVAGTTFTWTALNTIGTVTGYAVSGTGTINNTLTNTGTGDGQVTYTITPHGPGTTNCPGPAFELKVNVLNCAPKIGVAKQLVSLDNNGDGTYDALFNIRVQNYGNVTLDNIQVTDLLNTGTLTGKYVVLGISSANFAVNTAFNGNSDQNLLVSTGNSLAVGASSDIRLRIKILSAGTTYSNQVTASSTTGTVTDLSVNGSDPDTNHDGNPSESSPTPINTTCSPAISVTANNGVMCHPNVTFNQTFQTVATVSGTTSYFWTTDGTGTFSSTTELTPTYMPSASDVQDGQVRLKITGVSGGICPNGEATMVLTIWKTPATPTATVTQPTCSTATGTIEVTSPLGLYEYNLDGGSWQASTTFTGVAAGLRTINVRNINSTSCTSSASVTVNSAPTRPASATASTTIQPTCSVPTGTIVVTVPVGAYEYNIDGGAYQSSTTFAGIIPGSHNILVRSKTDNSCISASATSVTVNAIPAVPAAATASTTIQPTCSLATGTIVVTSPVGAAYEYNIDGGSYQSSPTFAGIGAGAHSILVRNVSSPTCVSTATLVSVNAPPTAPASPTATITQPTCSTSTGTIVITSPLGVYEYNIDGGSWQASTTFTGVTAGLRTINVRNINNTTCTSSASFTVNSAPPAVTLTLGSLTNTQCNASAGSVVLTASSAGTIVVNGVSQSVTAGDLTKTFTGLAAGFYTATFTATTGGCTATKSFNIANDNSTLAATVSVPAVTCYGGTATATVTATGGTGAGTYTYSINGGGFGASNVFSGLTAGSYNIVVKDGNNCSFSVAFAVSVPTQIVTHIASQTNVLCYGLSTGSITLNSSGGTAPYQYSLDGGTYQTGNVFSGLAASATAHTITTKDANGCTIGTTTATITGPSAALDITATAAVITPATCYGSATGAINITVTGGTGIGTYTYLWSNGLSTEDITGLAAGTYDVTVTDANGCTVTGSYTVTQPAAPQTLTLGTLVNTQCNASAGSVVLTASSAGTIVVNGVSQSVTAGDLTRSFTGLAAGFYTATFTATTGGCTATKSFNIANDNSTLTATVSVPAVTCYGGTATATVTATGGTGAGTYTYSINGGGFGASNVFSGLTAGSYNIVVKDGNNCSFSVAFAVSVPTQIVTHIASQTNVLCYGLSTGSITLNSSGGTAPYQYSLDGGTYQTGNVFSGLAASATAHTITTKDANGCTIGTTTATITGPSAALDITATAAVITPATCYGSATGAINITVTGGTGIGTYTYLWSNGLSTEDITGLAAGTYDVTVTDANGCTVTGSYTVTQPAAPQTLTLGTLVNTQCNASAGSVVLTASSAGTIVVNGVSQSVTAGDLTRSFTGLAAGFYTATFTATTGGCTATKSFNIANDNSTLTATVSVPAVTCYGGTATATVTATGGTGAGTYTYSINGGGFGASNVFSGLTAGSYNIVVKDGNNCSFSVAFAVSVPTQIVTHIASQTNVLCYGLSTGSITLNSSGGTAPYQYSLDGGTYQTGNVFSGLAASATAHTITTKDANGCTIGTTTATITGPSAALDITATAAVITPATCYGSATGAINITVTGGTGIGTYTYLWSNGFSTEDITGLAAGTYDVTVTDANGCTVTGSYTVTQPAAPQTLTLGTLVNTQCNASAGSVVLTASSAGTIVVNGVSQSVTAGDLTKTFTGLAAGFYTATFTATTGGCTATKSFNIINDNSTLTATVSVPAVTCYGGTATATVTATGGTGAGTYTYSINGGGFGASNVFSGLTAGSYNIVVKDGNNCSFSVAFAVSVPTQIVTHIASQTNVLCYGLSTGSITLNSSGGTAPYQYSLDGGTYQTGNVFSGLAASATAHTITTKDANGCTIGTTTATITGPSAALDITATAAVITPATCYGSATGAINITVTGGTGIGTYTYLWSNGFSTEDITGLAAGTYDVTVTDANGCTVTGSYTVTQPAAPQTLTLGTLVNTQCNASAGSVVLTASSAGTIVVNGVSQSVTAGDLTKTFTGLAAGFYTATFTATTGGCTATKSFNIANINSTLAATVSVANPNCFGGTVTATVTATGGTAPYSYRLNGGTAQPTGVFNTLAAGNYNVLVTDNNGCTYTVAFTITQPSQLVLSLANQTNVSCKGLSDGRITVQATGGTTPYTYTITTGTASISENIVTGMKAGNYIIKVVDTNLCSTTLNVTITETTCNPVAVNDNPTTPEDITVTGNVLSNDSDPNTPPLPLSVTQFLINGTPYAAGTSATISGIGTLVVYANGNYTFTPVANYNGPVPPVTYIVSNGTKDSNAELTITVTPVNNAPIAGVSVMTSQVNPGGINSLSVPVNKFSGTDADGTIASIKIMALPTFATSITVNGTLYNSGNFPVAGIIIPTNTAGQPLWDISVDPLSDGAVTSVISYYVIDNSGSISTNPGSVTIPFTGLSVSGNVFNDVNGLSNGIVDGTNLGVTVYMNLVSTLNQVIKSVAVTAGTYSFSESDGLTVSTSYKLILTSGLQTAGTTLSSATYPVGWVSTGENIGSSVGSDGISDGILSVNTNLGSLANANFGIEQLPTASTSTVASQANPGNSNLLIIDPAAFTGTDADAGTVTNIHYTGFPTGVASVTIGGVSYTLVTWPSGGVTVATGTGVSVDPEDGTGSVVLPFRVIDNAGKESSNTATVTLPIADLTITGRVFHDGNGAAIDGTGSGTAGTAQLYANLVSTATGKIVGVVSVNSNGTYSLGTTQGVKNNTNYTVVLSTTQGLTGGVGSALLPAGWANTAEELASVNDGSADGVLAVSVATTSVVNASFGIEQLPVATTITVGSQLNPGGTNLLTIVPASFTGSDADGSIANIHYTTFPTGITSITIGGSSYTVSTWPVGGVTVGALPAVSIDPLDGAGNVVIPFKVIDNAGKESTNEATLTLPVTDLTISGTIYNDANGLLGLPANMVDGTATNVSGTIYANIVDGSDHVVKSVAVALNGTYTFTTSDGINTATAYAIILTNSLQTPGTTLALSTYPTGWVSTGENLGAGAGSDGTVDGKLAVNTTSGNVANANFGIEQLPTAVGATAATQPNPGGTANVSVATTLYSGTDPAPGNISFIKITAFPDNVTSITIAGINYISGTFPVAGVTIAANTDGNPTSAISIDPADGSVSPVIQFKVIDNAGKESANTASVIIPFGTLTITGNIFNDSDGLTDNTVNGTGIVGGALYINLVNTFNQVVKSTPVGAGGIYSFSEADGLAVNTSYKLIITSNFQTAGTTLSVATYPSGWVSTGENIGITAGNDGTIDGILPVNTNTGSVSNANFGIKGAMSLSAGLDAAICSSDVTYILGGASASNYTLLQWTTNGTGSFTDPGILHAEYKPSAADIATGEIQLTLTATGVGGISTMTDVMTLTIWKAATAFAGNDATICSGIPFVLTGATAANYSSITWTSAGGTFNNIHALNPTFTPTTTGPITITLNASGMGTCLDAASSLTLTVNDTPTLLATVTANTQCNASVGAVILTGSVPGTVSLNGGAPVVSPADYTGLSAGFYTATFTAAAGGCTATTTFNIVNTNSTLAATVDVPDPLCFGGLTTAKVIATGGTAPYSYVLNGVKTNSTGEFADLQAGKNNVLVTDHNGCTYYLAFDIDQPTLLVAQISEFVNVTCKGTASGTATVDVTGGTTGYTYVWNTTPVQTTAKATGLAPGTYTVNVTDNHGCTAAANVTITESICKPIAVNDFSTLSENTTATGNVLTNDSDPNGLALTVTNFIMGGTTYPANSMATIPGVGTLVIHTDGSYTFTPVTNFRGPIPVAIYEVTNGTNSSTATLSITIIPVNHLPVAVTDTYFVNEDKIITANLGLNDILSGDGGNIWSVVTGPAHGTLVINVDGTFSYTPNAGYNGSDSFEYKLCDTDGSCSSATVTLTVKPMNNAPVTVNENLTICGNSVLTGNVLANGDYDPDGTTLSVGLIPVSGPAHGTFTIQSNGDFIYIPNSSYNGTDQVTVSVCDSGTPLPAACTNDVIRIAVSQAPTAFAGNDAIICESMNYTLLTATVSNNNGQLWTTSGTGTFNNPASVNAIYTPSAVDINNGSVALTLTAFGNTPCGNVSSTVTLSFSKAPLANAGTNGVVCQGSPFTASGASAGNYSSLLWTTNGKGTLTGETTLTPTYIPGANETGIVTLTLKANPKTGCQSPAYATTTITFISSASVSAGANATICESDIYVLSESSASNAISMIWYTSGVGYFNNPTTLHPTYVPNALDIANGSVTLTLNVTPSVSCPTISQSMVLSFARKAIANAGSDATIDEGSAFTVSTASSQNATSVLWSHNGLGTLTGANTLQPTYTPALGETGLVTLTLNVGSSSPCGSATDKMILTIQHVNHPPVAAPDNYEGKENTPLQGNLLPNDKDIDGDQLSVNPIPVKAPAHGTLVLLPNGDFTYKPNIDFMGTDTFIYQVCDNGSPSLCSETTVTIVLGEDDTCEVFVPNSFSPNGDGIHDTFKVRCLYNYENPVIEIFNRYGNLVYKKDHYGNIDYWGSEKDAWWDGRSENKLTIGNQYLPVGTYYYVLKLNAGKVLTGFLFLNK